MGSHSRTQLVVYAAVGVALLLLGARWIRSADSGSASPGSVSYSSGLGSSGSGLGSSSSGSGSFGVDDTGGGDLVVDVTGAVGRPGVYTLPAGSRVNDAVQRAGGATAKGDVQQINLAARLADGQQIVIPSRVKNPAGVAEGATVSGSAAVDGPISIGTATVEELDTIEGIGPVTAQNIIGYRDQHGGVSSIDQLDEIDGIGPATMEALRARLQP
jgi:competence protein ComEA